MANGTWRGTNNSLSRDADHRSIMVSLAGGETGRRCKSRAAHERGLRSSRGKGLAGKGF